MPIFEFKDADFEFIDDDKMICPDCNYDKDCPVCDGVGEIEIDKYLKYLKGRIEYRWRMYDREQKKYKQLTGVSHVWFK